MGRVEIEDFGEFFHTFAERCFTTSLNMKNGKDPSDEGWDIIEEVHRLFFDGRLTFCKTVIDSPDKPMTQGGLFADEMADKQ